MTSHLSVKKWMSALALVASIGSSFAEKVNPVEAVIPKPVEAKATEGYFAFDRATYVSAAPELKTLSDMFANSVRVHTGILLTQSTAFADAKAIKFKLTELGSQSKEAYTIEVTEKEVLIKAPSEAGLYYGGMTLIQMTQKASFGEWQVPCSTVKDEPRFAWRGLMLDEARHFHGKEAVKQLLETMALHKMNRFHWHLTDDEGWRVEVKGYPKLTEVGAWRGQGTTMPRVKWRNPEQGKSARYGGFYTQEDLKEIVAFAAARNIEIIPEFDMPGHVTALKTAYPELCVTPDAKLLEEIRKKGTGLKQWELSGDSGRAYRGNVMDVTKPETYKFCEALFDQMTAIFPSKYWHIGGDEVRPLYWRASPAHIALMKEKGFKEPFEIQNMFLKRMSKMLRERGRIMMGWNEILHGGDLPKDTIVMGWLGDGPGIKAAKLGYPTVMANSPYNYFDMGYPGKGELKANGWAGQIDSKKAYEWDPVFPGKIDEKYQKNVKGVHACVWSEYVFDALNMSYKFWPRAASVAEVGWTPQADRNWDDYKKRFGKHARFLDNLNVTYRVAPPFVTLAKGKATIESYIPGYTVIYTTDGSTPVPGQSKVYNGEVFTGIDFSKIRAMAIRPSGLKSIVVEGAKRTPLNNFRIKGAKPTVIKADFTSELDKAGQWTAFLSLDPSKRSPMKVSKLIVKKDGKVIVESKLNVTTDANGATLPFELKDFDKSAKYTIELSVKLADKKGKTFGELSVDR